MLSSTSHYNLQRNIRQVYVVGFKAFWHMIYFNLKRGIIWIKITMK